MRTSDKIIQAYNVSHGTLPDCIENELRQSYTRQDLMQVNTLSRHSLYEVDSLHYATNKEKYPDGPAYNYHPINGCYINQLIIRPGCEPSVRIHNCYINELVVEKDVNLDELHIGYSHVDNITIKDSVNCIYLSHSSVSNLQGNVVEFWGEQSTFTADLRGSVSEVNISYSRCYLVTQDITKHLLVAKSVCYMWLRTSKYEVPVEVSFDNTTLLGLGNIASRKILPESVCENSQIITGDICWNCKDEIISTSSMLKMFKNANRCEYCGLPLVKNSSLCGSDACLEARRI